MATSAVMSLKDNVTYEERERNVAHIARMTCRHDEKGLTIQNRQLQEGFKGSGRLKQKKKKMDDRRSILCRGTGKKQGYQGATDSSKGNS